MHRLLKKIYMKIQDVRIWDAKMSEKLRIRITSTPKEPRYRRPNMNNLRGKKGREILAEIRNMKPAPIDELRKEAEFYMNIILKKREEREELKRGLIANVESQMKTDEVVDGFTKYVSALQGQWFECYLSQDEVEASVEYALRLMEMLNRINDKGLNRERLKELESQVNDKHSAVSKIEIRHAILGQELITDEVNELVEEIAKMRRVRGTYWLLMARPAFMSVIYAIYDRIVDQFDDEDLFIHSTFFLLRGILKMHSNEIEEPTQEENE